MPSQPEIEAKRRIEDSLRAFKSGSFRGNAVAFFTSMGYRSTRTEKLEPNTPAGLLGLVNKSDFLNPKRAKADEWKSVDFLFQLTDQDIRKLGESAADFGSTTIPLFTDKQIDSYIFFAINLKNDSYSRTQLADITRELNRLFPMPALVLFKHGETLSLSIIDRRVHKRDAGRDVLKKVTLIKDIGFAETHRGHLEILYDLAFPQLAAEYEINNFVQLDDAWRKALDSSKLNKRFYQDLANWYYWALQHVEFPKQEGVADDVNRATNVIRLITRLIFVWFLKERKLVPDSLFDEKELGKVLKDLSDDKSTFYKAILQNLFFATLNTPMNDPELPRIFRQEPNGKRVNDQYMVHNQYRYKELFNDPQLALQMFTGIPFLNGGLFECLDKREEVNGELIETRVDGFSDIAKKQPNVPNKLFFGAEQYVDLSKVYGTRNKRYPVRGLIDTLDRYKFTVDENTPVEEEVALDPELLGRVFENLLASYNADTDATARKQTGSYYTPREVVNYMVDESLILYLETHRAAKNSERNGDDFEVRLRHLFSYVDERHQFSNEEVDELVAAIDNLKILDPACGSGAFPMGILQKLVFILSKLDPSNAKWKQRQIARVREAMRAADKIQDHEFRENTLQDLQTQILNIEEAFARNELDYGRKVFLIENCIYGVDIQPIAIQIAKLRFFISLIIDQKVNPGALNLGIRPLPNLETRFVAANALLNVKGQIVLRSPEIAAKERELRRVREQHFLARTTSRKEKLRQDDKNLREQIGDLINQLGLVSADVTRKLMEWDPYNQNASATFFDPEWMFNIKEGFDIVIGNPPYGVSVKGDFRIGVRQNLGQVPDYEIYYYFVEVAHRFAKASGIKSYIIPNTFLFNVFAANYRKKLLANWDLKMILDCTAFKIFEGSTVFNAITLFQKGATLEQVGYKKTLQASNFAELINEPTVFLPKRDLLINNQNWGLAFRLDENVMRIIAKVKSRGTKLEALFPELSQGLIAYDKYQGQSKDIIETRAYHFTGKEKKGLKKWLRGEDVTRYVVSWNGSEWIDYCDGLANRRQPKFFLGERLLVREITNPSVFCGITSEELYHDPSVIVILNSSRSDLKFLLGTLNSRFATFYHFNSSPKATKGAFPKILVEDLKNFPIPKVSRPRQNEVADLVNLILSHKRDDPNFDTSSIEDTIDQLVYDLYELTPGERAIVEKSTTH